MKHSTVTEIVLGRAADAVDYVDYCAARGDRVAFLEPTSDVELTPEAVSTWVRSQSGLGFDVGEANSVVSFRDAFQVHADLLREALGLPSRSVEAVRCLTDKSRFKSHPAVRPYVADHVEVDLEADFATFERAVAEQLAFPVVLKPSNGFYSAGVIRVDEPEHLRRAWRSVRRVCSLLRSSRGTSKIHAEVYLDGMETMADGFVVDGVVHSLLHHVKLPKLTGVPSFHETGCVTQPFELADSEEMTAILEAVVSGVGLDNSAFNAEFRYDAAGKLHLLEIGPRLSGGGASVQNLLRICTGLDAYDIQRQLGGIGRVSDERRASYSLDLAPRRRGFALEYDFCASRNGYLARSEELVARLHELPLDTLLRYRTDGDYVFAPPMNVETIMTAFFSCASAQGAEELLHEVIATCSIHTELGPESPTPPRA